MKQKIQPSSLGRRFRGYLPVIIDVETGGLNPMTDALLEIAAVTLNMTANGRLRVEHTFSTHVKPFPNARIDPKALEINGIVPDSPLRDAQDEHAALNHIFQPIRAAVKVHGCTRAILVGHNASFDLAFLNEAVKRSGIRRNPFHTFSSFDTVSLAGLAYGQTVLSKAIIAAGLSWNEKEAHSAIYDAERTAELFCDIVNRWDRLNPEMLLRIQASDP